ncbi:MAG: FecR domain-containing protein [Tannerellaceae bacterium]
MHDLVTKYFDQRITQEERKQLFTDMETDVELRHEFISMQNICGLFSFLPCESDLPDAMSKLIEFKKKHRKKSFTLYSKHIIGYAAAICLAVVSTWMSMNYVATGEGDEQTTYDEFYVPSGQRAQVKLHDGTIVWLNARSSLRYPSRFAKGTRRVELDGEAFFEVAHDEKAPFVVATEKMDIKVLGTKFNVFAYKGRDEFNTSLIEGSVKIYREQDEANALYMQPNERAELIGNKLVKHRISNTDYLLWKEGVYSFDDVPFERIMKKLELYYDITIVVKNNSLKSYKFSGKFRQRDGVESVLHTLGKVYLFTYTKDEERNVITIK